MAAVFGDDAQLGGPGGVRFGFGQAVGLIRIALRQPDDPPTGQDDRFVKFRFSSSSAQASSRAAIFVSASCLMPAKPFLNSTS